MRLSVLKLVMDHEYVSNLSLIYLALCSKSRVYRASLVFFVILSFLNFIRLIMIHKNI